MTVREVETGQKGEERSHEPFYTRARRPEAISLALVTNVMAELIWMDTPSHL